MFFAPPVPEPVVAATGPPSSSLPPPPQITITIPFATACYSGAGFYITYTMLISDLAKDLVWQCQQRYSAFRSLHVSVGKYFNTGVSFPGMLMTSRSNRNKAEITMRREKLERYMQALLETVFSAGGGEKPLHRVAKLLQFIEHPFECDFTRSSLSVDNSDLTSTVSETVASGKNAKISALDQPKTYAAPPVVITSRWRAPAALPGPDIGLGMPFVTVAQSVSGEWEMLIKGDKQLRKGLLRHRYDEAAAMCSFMASRQAVMDAAEAQDFIVEFRRKHPLAAYLRLEKALECQSPTSASRSDRSSQLDPRSVTPRVHPEVNEEEVGSPVVHHRRDSASGFSFADHAQIFNSSRALPAAFLDAGGAHFNLRRDYLSVQRTHMAVMASCEEVESPTAAEGGGTPRERTKATTSPTNAGRDLQPPQLHGSPVRRREPRSSQPRTESAAERYVRLVTGERVAGCCCTAKAFCTSPGFGDLYQLKCGVTLVVCPPPNGPPGDD
jgi:hypothetical protein